MKAFFQFILRSTAAGVSTVSTGLISFFAFSQTFLLASVYAIVSGAVVYLGVKQVTNYRLIRSNGLTIKEYRYIGKNLKEAKQKISRLQKAFIRVRRWDQAKQNLDIIRTVRKIYANTKNEPKRFYQAESFYYKNLDSLVEIAEKYAFLSSQPTKSIEMTKSLHETKHTIRLLGESVKKDLYVMLDDDVDTLHFELDVAKQTIDRTKNDKGRLLK